MKLTEQLVHSGDLFFRHRGSWPLVLFPLFFLGLFEARLPATVPVWLRAWQVFSVIVALSGLAVRIVAIGTAPPGTSERSTTSPRALMLRTTGLYSLVRHPLYVGNTLTALGLACFTTAWYLPVIVLLASALYHERICAREEAFLEQQFGDEFLRWADRVPAAVPRASTYVPSTKSFVWRKVLGREFHGLMVIGASVFVLDLARGAMASGRVSFDPLWTGFFALTTLVFVVGFVLKRTTSVFAARASVL